MKRGIYLLFFSIYVLFSPGHFYVVDHIQVFQTTQSLVEDHSLLIAPSLNAAPGPAGKAYAPYGLGQSVLSIPLYLVGKFVSERGSPSLQMYFARPDVYTDVVAFFVSHFNEFVTPLTCVLIYLFGTQLGYSPRTALGVTLTFGLATNTWVYAEQYFQQPLETLFLFSAIYVLFSRRQYLQPSHTLVAGCLLGLGLLTRSNMLTVIPIVMTYGWLLLRTQNPYRGMAALASPLVGALCIVLYLNALRFGHIFNFGPQTAPGFGTPPWEGMLGYLVSPGRSVFLYSPPLILSLLAFRQFYHRYRLEGGVFIAICGVYFVLFSSYTLWGGGWSWGPRYLLPTLPFLILPLGYAFQSRLQKLVLVVLGGLGVGIQIIGIVVNYAAVYNDTLGLGVPERDYLFDLVQSPILTHFERLLHGNDIDLWLVWIYHHFGLPFFLLTLVILLFPLAGAVYYLRMGADNALAVAAQSPPQTPVGARTD